MDDDKKSGPSTVDRLDSKESPKTISKFKVISGSKKLVIDEEDDEDAAGKELINQINIDLERPLSRD